jgi:hypothetical protein
MWRKDSAESTRCGGVDQGRPSIVFHDFSQADPESASLSGAHLIWRQAFLGKPDPKRFEQGQ